MFRDLGQLSSFKNIKNTFRRVLFLVKLQVLLLNKANSPKSQAKITSVKRKPHALRTSAIAISEQNIHGVKYARTLLSSNPCFPVYGKIRVS